MSANSSTTSSRPRGSADARKYALSAIAAAVVMFFALIATNLLIDPQYVFGTDFLPQSNNPNRYYRTVTAYQAAPQRYDGLFFASSRGQKIPLSDLSRRMNLDFGDFHAPGGTLSDFLPIAEYVFADKAARGDRLRAVFVMLDVDAFGLPPVTNTTLSAILPPPVGGITPVRFWWKFLTTVQFVSWHSAIRDAVSRWESGRVAPPWWFAPARKLFGRIGGELAGRAQAKPGDELFAVINRVAAAVGEKPPVFITRRSHFAADLERLHSLVALCRRYDAKLIVAATPLSRQNEDYFDGPDLADAISRISQVTPFWDFTRTGAITDQPGLWPDISHFNAPVATMMFRRIFGEDMPPGWNGFGRLRQPEAAGTAR
jgi:hypothetical protein